MPSSGRTFDVGGALNAMPNLGPLRNRFLRIIGLILFAILLFASITSVPTGNVGVLTLFGKVTGEVLLEGIHVINPLKSVQKLSIQTQSVKESSNTPSNEGLMLALDTSLLFHLDRAKAAQVFQTVGENYAEKIVEPTLRSAIRGSTSKHSANALYTNARDAERLDRSQATSRTGCAANELHFAKGKAGSRTQADRSARHRRLSEDRR